MALDPRYGTRKTQEFICGGAAGQLLLSSKARQNISTLVADATAATTRLSLTKLELLCSCA